MDKKVVKETHENEELRSKYIWNLIQDNKKAVVRDNSAIKIPRVLVQFWNDAKAIPSDVQKCIDSWNKLCIDRELFDDETARKFYCF